MGESPWSRTDASPELWAYTKLVGEAGGDQVGASAYMYCTYLFPGQGFAMRYIVRNHLAFTPSAPANPDEAVLLALSQYYNATDNDYWESTSPALPTYAHVQDLGYVMTSKPQSDKSNLLQSCYLSKYGSHFVASGNNCSQFLEGARVKPLGWVWQAAGPGRSALYQCIVDPNAARMMLSLDVDCSGKGKMQTILGYIVAA